MPTESRLRVARALHAVFGQGSRIPDAWDEDLPREDAAFGQALLGVCLRHWGRLQAHVQPRLRDAARGLPLGTQVSLAIGLAQLAWLPGVSDHAAVHESVDLAADRALGFPPHKGLVNALLRADAKDREALRRALEALPASLDRSPFVEQVLRAALGPDPQEERIEALWSRLQEPSRPAFRAVKQGSLPDGLVPDPDLPGCLKLAPDAPFPREWLASGAGMVQDRSSQALMTFRWDRPVQRIAD
ncbi:MAG TPA: transcription antitermination factor NusB, partial [Holophaga sp.]|nr:transcription antitermination factor NusB [Holophaga sp.]